MNRHILSPAGPVAAALVWAVAVFLLASCSGDGQVSGTAADDPIATGSTAGVIESSSPEPVLDDSESDDAADDGSESEGPDDDQNPDSDIDTGDASTIQGMLDEIGGATGTDAAQPDSTTTTSVGPASRTLPSGRHCWAGPADGYEMTVASDGAVTMRAYVTDDSVDRTVTTIERGRGGFVEDGTISLGVESWTASGFTTFDADYVVADGRLEPSPYPGLKVAPADCAVFDQTTVGTSDLNVRSRETVKFAAGASGASIDASLVRAEVVVYELEASRGQTMTAAISSLEDNAAVSIYTPEGQLVSDNEDGHGSRSLVLPQSGVYEVAISSIRGNVSFTLDISIT